MNNRRKAMRAAIIEMVGELITEDLLRDIEVAAVESDQGGDKPIMAALSVTLKWQAGQDPCDMLAKCAYSVRHVVEADRVVDPAQMTLDEIAEGDK
jgi:hypothetical protein